MCGLDYPSAEESERISGIWRSLFNPHALPFVFVLGLPLFLLFSRIRLFSWWGSIMGGALGASLS
jgi:hypothetical protein